MRHITREPFARRTLAAERVPTALGCRECNRTLVTPTGRPYLYKYLYIYDDRGTVPLRGHFCSVACLRAYNA
jgi:ribosomal protein S27E